MQVLRQTLPWRPCLTDCNIFSFYFSCFGLFVDTSWFKINDGSSLPHKCRLHHLFECYEYMPDTRYFLSYWSSWTVEEGDMVTFFSGPRIGASGENVSPPTTGHRKGQNWSGVSVGKKLFSFFFLKEATAGTPSCNVSRKHSNIWPADVQHQVEHNAKTLPFTKSMWIQITTQNTRVFGTNV